MKRSPFMLEDNNYVRFIIGWGTSLYWSWQEDDSGHFRGLPADRSISFTSNFV